MVMVGHSDVVGKPVALQLLNELATVTVCHLGTRDLALHTRRAEILVVAAGKAGLIRGEMIRPGALVVDVGINRVKRNGKPALVGDVAWEEALAVAGEITPVPGGVGPLTLACLMRNLAALAGGRL